MWPVFLGVGSNLGDRYASLMEAAELLGGAVSILAVSPVYETAPWGDVDQPAFLNLCIAGTTRLQPLELLAAVKRVEADMGRAPTRRWGPRVIDVDILLYDRLIIHEPELSIPHVSMPTRAFVLVPLADLIPDFVHPQLGKSIGELLAAVDRSGIERYRHAA